MLDRRQDQITSNKITEALRIKTAFGPRAALLFLRHRGVAHSIAYRTLAGRYDPRQRRVGPRQVGNRPQPSAFVEQRNFFGAARIEKRGVFSYGAGDGNRTSS